METHGVPYFMAPLLERSGWPYLYKIAEIFSSCVNDGFDVIKLSEVLYKYLSNDDVYHIIQMVEYIY